MTPQPSEQPTRPFYWAGCPICGSEHVMRLRDDWQAQVASGAAIPIVGCGNPWHYFLDRAAAAPDPVATCSTCRHPYSEHTGRGLQAGRLSPEEARMGGGCEHGEDFHHTCSCSRYVEGAVASPAPLDVALLARALLGHPWAGKDGHNCTGCPDGSPWRCDRPAHAATEEGTP